MQRRGRANGWAGWRAPAVLAVVRLLAGCESLQIPAPGSNTQSQDLVSIRQSLDGLIEETQKTNRIIPFQVDNLSQNVNGMKELMSTNRNEVDNRLTQQDAEIKKLRDAVRELSFQLETLSTTMQIRTGQAPVSSGSSSANSSGSSRESSSPSTSNAPSPPARTETARTEGPAPSPTPASEQAMGYELALREKDLGRYEQARQGFAKALAQGLPSEQKVEAQYQMAECSFLLEDYPAAIEQYTKLIQENSTHARAWEGIERLAQIYTRQNQKDQAISLYEAINVNYPDYPNIERVREQLRMLRGTPPGGDN